MMCTCRYGLKNLSLWTESETHKDFRLVSRYIFPFRATARDATRGGVGLSNRMRACSGG
jgi:hypothetical protein